MSRSLRGTTIVVFTVMAADCTRGAEERLVFNRDIRPILSDHCFQCHGPDAGTREADLRLDVREEALAAGAIVPGDPAASAVMARIESQDPDEVMPPPEAHKELDNGKRALIVRWIAEGAEYQKHWAYEPPRKPPVPARVNGVDHFIDARLRARSLEPVGEADRRTLVRRLSFDLLGLPPTLQEVAAFETDASAGAYEALVDRLLASPHYGERMAVVWLDVVRFADTIGYHSDNPRNIWPYRDWVIAAFNDNKPFDRFTIEQLAGDLLPDATMETRLGSAFNRLLLTTEEGGAQPKDYEARMLTDRVRAVGTVWLGQTIGCAQCHDHKFDPITMHDFYALGSFFADIQESIIGKREDGMPVPSGDAQDQIARLEQAVTAARRDLEVIGPELEAAQRDWEAELAAGRVALAELAADATVKPEDVAAATTVAVAVAKPAAARSDADRQAVANYFRGRVSKPAQTAQERLDAAEKDLQAFQKGLPRCLVSVSGTPRTVRILPRGNWMDESQPPVKPALPGFLPQPAPVEGRDLTRLDLANWLVSRDNPLTARVTVNRLWRQFFGAGLSRNLEDLGSQGEPPTNPELLDWLACELVDSGWNIKHVVRNILTSRAYRRSSMAPAALFAADPDNREWARQSAVRLEAEFVRDAALAASGLLVRTVGGPSVLPYQPDGYWENLNFPVRQYPTDGGEKQHRRGLYVWWQRTFLHPAMLAFDAPSREECCAERTRSNIPQQALVLLNDPSYVEAARVLASLTLRDGPDTSEERVAFVWQRVLQRLPRQEEVAAVLPLVETHLAFYKANPAAAAELLQSGQTPLTPGIDATELAAWTHVARVLFNLHETITRS